MIIIIIITFSNRNYCLLYTDINIITFVCMKLNEWSQNIYIYFTLKKRKMILV